MKVNIGLDIGIASVGWSILDEHLKIIKYGVRLFPTVDDPKDSKLNNEVRREKRSMRRQKNRRKNLKLDFIKMLKRLNLIELTINPYDRKLHYYQEFIEQFIDSEVDLFKLRQKGLKEPLNKKELIQVLYWYLSHRGFKYEIANDKEKEKISKIFGEDFNHQDLPINIQTKFFKNNGFYRSELNRLFSSADYIKEIDIILKTSKIDEQFCHEYLELFKRQRSFELGPGPKTEYKNLQQKNYHLISLYSRYYVDQETGVLSSHENIWDKTIGKCTYYPDEFRAPKNALTSEMFNLLNDLNNLTVGGKFKLSFEQKLDCIKIAFKTKINTNKIIEYITKTFNVENEDVKGFRVDKKRVRLITPLTSLHFINKKIKEFNQPQINFEQVFDGKTFNFDLVDQIVDVLSKTKILEKRIANLNKIDYLQNNPELIKSIALGPSWSDTHALSYKVMKLMNIIMLESNKNQMQIAHELNLKNSRQLNIDNKKYIPTNWIDDLIGTPSVKRALRQTINLLNEIFKKHKDYKIDNIVVEMAREHKNTEAREAETELQKFMENRRKSLQSIIDAVKTRHPDQKIQGKILAKLWLYEQQKGLDAYTGLNLDRDELVINPHYVDIDHIIPYSQCFDDSRNNKVLTTKFANSEKGQQTPYEWKKDKPEEWLKLKNLWNEWYSPKNNTNERKIFASQKKLENITSEIDFSNPENSLGFIKRNLVDTRYVTRELLGVLNEFKEIVGENHPLKNVKIKTVNGKMTSFYRKIIEKGGKLLRPAGISDGSFNEETGKKERIWNGHHAEDAVIIVHIALRDQRLSKVIEKVLSNPDIDKLNQAQEKWAIESKKDSDKYFESLRNELNDCMNDVKFSYMLNKKRNIQFFNETLYGIKKKINDNQEEQIHKVEKLKLVDLKPKQLSEIFSENYKYEIPMKEYDPKTFKGLKQRYTNELLSEGLTFKKLADKYGTVNISIFSKKDNNAIVRPIKSIKVIKAAKDKDSIIMRDNDKAFYETMNWTEIHLFKNIKGEYRIIPINATVANYKNDGTFNYKNLYFSKLAKMDIEEKTPLHKLYRGTIITDKENNLYRVCGLDERKQSLELKRLDGKNKDIRNYYTLNTKLIDYSIAEVDYLGNVFLKMKFEKNILLNEEYLIKPNEKIIDLI